MKTLRARLSAAGVKRTFLNGVVLPSWWDDAIADSYAGVREAAGDISGVPNPIALPHHLCKCRKQLQGAGRLNTRLRLALR